MKKLSVSSFAVLVLALLIAVGSRSFLGPCVHEDGSFGACHWAGQAMFGLGLLMMLQSAFALLWRDRKVRAGILAATAMTAVLGCFVPGPLISLCGMATMRCRAVMQPAMILLCLLAALTAAAGCAAELRRSRAES